MSKIEIPEKFIHKIGASMAMDLHVIDVVLKNGKKYKKLAVRGGRFITGYYKDLNGETKLDFKSEDIKKVRRSSFWPLF